MGLVAPYTSAFFTGTAATTSVVPAQYPCALNGFPYLIDDKMIQDHTEESVPAIKSQFVNTGEPGDRTLNPEAAWRRATSSWHHGAGQSMHDDEASDRFRFRSSKGVDVWTRGKLTLLDDTEQVTSVAGTAVFMVASQGYVYFADGQTVKRTDGATTTSCTGTPAATITGLATLGAAVYAAYGASGIYKITGTSGGGAAWLAGTYAGIAVAKQRIIAWNANYVYDVSAASATTIYQRTVDTSFAWSCAGDGVGNIYLGGNSSTTGTIYRTAVVADGTALGAPVVAGRLPEGETVQSLFGYAGVLFIGTSQGWRAAEQDSSGNLSIGPLVDVDASVSAWSAYGQYVYFGWSDFDGDSTGIGRIDPTVLNDSGAYAYASDLMVTGSGAVQGIAILNASPMIGVSALGIYQTTGAPVTSGTIELGQFNFGLTENKLVLGGAVGYSGSGTASLYISTDEGDFELADESGFNHTGVYFEPRILIASSGGVSPTVRSQSMRAYTQQRNSVVLTVPLIITDAYYLPEAGSEFHFDVGAGVDNVRACHRDRNVVTYQEGLDSWAVTVEDYKFVKRDVSDHFEWNGTLVVKMKVVQ